MKEGIWRRKDGALISIDKMTDNHLSNAIKMMARTLIPLRNGKPPSSEKYEALVKEARKRGFRVVILPNPTTMNGKIEYVDVFIPNPQSKLATDFFPSELDSREHA